VTLLLDTHTFIWLDAEPARLSPRAAVLLTDPANRIVLSVASIWELVIKVQLGKLTLRDSVDQIVAEQLNANKVDLLDIKTTHVFAIAALPTVHKDPFDRILAAQAIVHGVPLVTADAVFAQYPVRVEW